MCRSRPPHHRSPICEAEICVLQHLANAGIVQRVHEEVDVYRCDLMGASMKASSCDEVTDDGNRLVDREVVDRHSEEQRRWSPWEPAHHVVSTFRAVLVQVTESGRTRTRNQSPIFQAIVRGARSSARYVLRGASTERRPAITWTMMITAETALDRRLRRPICRLRVIMAAAPIPHSAFVATSTESGGTRWSKIASTCAVRSSPGPRISRRASVGMYRRAICCRPSSQRSF